MSKDTTKKIAVGAAIAGVAGYIAGILTAPKSGKETRKDVKNAAVKAKSEAEKQLKHLHSDLGKLIEKAKISSTKFKNFANSDFEKAINKANKAKDKAKQMLTAVHEGEADDKDLQKSIEEAIAALSHLKEFVRK